MLLRSYIFDIPEFLINYFPYVNLSSIELFRKGKVEIIAKNFRDTKCISGLKSFAGREGRGTCNISWHFIERENLSKKFYARR